MFKNNLFYYWLVAVFVLYFKEIIILNEKFLLLVISIAFVLFLRDFLKEEIESFFKNLNKELVNEIFLHEYSIDAKYGYMYYYSNLDLLRKKVYHKVYDMYLKNINFLSIFYYNSIFRRENHNLIVNYDNLINEIYYFVMKKHLFIKLNFLYRSYYYIFYKFKI